MRLGRGLAAFLVVVLVAGCGGGSGASPAGARSAVPRGAPSGAPSGDPVGDARAVLDVEAAIERLAEAGIAVHEDAGATAPIAAVAEPASPFRLLRFQVENAVAEAAAGGGTGADAIDDLMAMPEDGPPLSAILAGYVATADTPGGDLARAVMAGQDLEQPASLVFPTLVLAAFVGEVTAASATRDPAFGLGAPVDLPLPRDPPVAARLAAARLAAAGDGPCGDFSRFFTTTLQQVASAIVGVLPNIPFLRAAIEWALTKGLAAGVGAAAALIERIPFIEAIRSAIGALALGVTVVAALRDWTVTVVADPPIAHHAVGPTVSRLTMLAMVDDGPGDVFSPAVRACADLLGIRLARGGATGSAATWHLTAGGSHAAAVASQDSTVDAAGRSTYVLSMARESEDAHERGAVANALVRVRVTVRRQDVDQVRRFIEGAITNALPAPVYSVLTACSATRSRRSPR